MALDRILSQSRKFPDLLLGGPEVEHLDARDGHQAHIFWGVGHHVGLRGVWVGVGFMG